MKLGLPLAAIALLALAATGCGNRLMQPMAGQTPESINPNTPTYGQAGGPLVPANNPVSGATVPPAAAAATTPLQREFSLYFRTNSAKLTQEARAIVQQAADAARQGPLTRIAVTGHTDTVGTARYNQRLSERRADAVRKALVADGVPADEITAKGAGKTDLAVPTAQGVNEPRNRRAVIMEAGPGA
jgi:outer membrane protein OmpA-like peptidoglycan-associated protein